MIPSNDNHPSDYPSAMGELNRGILAAALGVGFWIVVGAIALVTIAIIGALP